MKELNAQGTTIILTTHYLEEAEMLCRNIGIIQNGELVENTTMKQLLSKLESETFIFDLGAKSPLPKLEGYGYRLTDTSTLEVDVKREQGLNSLFSQLNVQGFRYKVCVTRPTVWKSCLSLWLMATRERKHDPPVLDSLAEYLDQRDYAVRTYLDSNLGATCDYDVSILLFSAT